jgi:hypothetical protein
VCVRARVRSDRLAVRESATQTHLYTTQHARAALHDARSFHDGGPENGPHVVPIADFFNHSCTDPCVRPALEADGFNVRLDQREHCPSCCELRACMVSIVSCLLLPGGGLADVRNAKCEEWRGAVNQVRSSPPKVSPCICGTCHHRSSGVYMRFIVVIVIVIVVVVPAMALIPTPRLVVHTSSH